MSTFNERLARGFMDDGHDVTIYTFSLQYPSFLFPGKTQFTDEPAPENIPIRSVINSINPLNWVRHKGPLAADETTRVRMLWANMQLHMEPYPQALIQRWNGHIETNGFLMFSCLGPDSLRELRPVFAQHGWPEPAHAFTDMHDWGDMLVHSGFAEPVMDMERITLSYSGAEPLLKELGELGRNLNAERFASCRSRAWRERLCRAIEAGLPRSPDGRLLLTFEVIYGHAFKPVPRVAMGPSTTLPVDDLRAMLRNPRR
ncbi:MAG: biotin synthase [Sphingobacteriales bacterium]|nr:MAG: biotin synthase [Sphingobacteriales bacterium]